ncbi:LysR family transcriptional regulator [Pseudorhodoferax sp.]|uniref:LysR family transcriptional regulator n=1 Tax=Pseudorhodoferax sp. TaxID=1993553 RepID=UPI002DD68D22|nr:LysR family transcriptional regulator [Pseudorhodoferax sp.]
MTFNRLHLIRQVDLFTLRLFLSAVEEEQIGRAAIRENIAASTATKRIQDLEEIAGMPLLARTPKGVVPTPAGEVVARCLRAMFGNLDDMRSEIAAFTEGVRGELTVASARSIIAPLLARELGDFARDFPGVDLVVRETENTGIACAVAQGDADIGVLAFAPELDLGAVDCVAYRNDRLVAVVPRTHALAGRRSVAFGDLMPEKVIALSALQHAFTATARRLGHPDYRAAYKVRSPEVAISMVQAGLGVTVQPECLLTREVLDSVTAVELDERWATRVIQIVTARGRPVTPQARALMKQLLERPSLGA